MPQTKDHMMLTWRTSVQLSLLQLPCHDATTQRHLSPRSPLSELHCRHCHRHHASLSSPSPILYITNDADTTSHVMQHPNATTPPGINALPSYVQSGWMQQLLHFPASVAVHGPNDATDASCVTAHPHPPPVRQRRHPQPLLCQCHHYHTHHQPSATRGRVVLRASLPRQSPAAHPPAAVVASQQP